MFLFIFLIVLLVFAIVFFIGFPIYKQKVLMEKYNAFCKRKIDRISKRNNYKKIHDLIIENYNLDKLQINHIIFGKKFIYLINDYCLQGDVSGSNNDNSWVYYNRVKKSTHYLTNLNLVANKNIQDFAGIFNVNDEILINISVIPDECNFQIKDSKNPKSFIVNYWMIRRLIKHLETTKISDLNVEQVNQIFELVNGKNEEGKRG